MKVFLTLVTLCNLQVQLPIAVAAAVDSGSKDDIVFEITDPLSKDKSLEWVNDPKLLQVLTRSVDDGKLLADSLTQFIQKHLQKKVFGTSLGDRSSAMNFRLKFASFSKSRSKEYIRFEQEAKFRFAKSDLWIPVHGGEVKVEKSILHFHPTPNSVRFRIRVRLYSRMPEKIPPIAGLELAFTGHEIGRFVHHLKVNKDQQEKLFLFLSEIQKQKKGQKYSIKNLKNDFHKMLMTDSSYQQDMMNRFLSAMDEASTLKLLEKIANENRLHYFFNREISAWSFECHEFFELPIHFDLLLSSHQKIQARHLRESLSSLQTVRAWDNPNYPPSIPYTSSSSAQAELEVLFRKVADHFAEFGWSIFDNDPSSSTLDVLTHLNGARYRENAFWNEKQNKFLLGAGGPLFEKFEKSLGVLGHEFTHAVIQKSSKLVFEGEPGALNEHFADLQGASLEAEHLQAGQFGFALDGGVMTEQARKKRTQLIQLSLRNKKYSPDEIVAFHLNEPKIRNFYAPSLSFSTQFEDYKRGQEYFGVPCVPSVDNDNCGVHALSGIPNKAASLIISKLGFHETKELFFDTLAHRLHSTASFIDYRNELLRACQEDDGLKDRCSVITESFAQVGVTSPVTETASPIKSSSGTSSKDPQWQKPTSRALLSGSQDSSRSLETEFLNFCGWIDHTKRGYITVVDGKFDTVISLFKDSSPHYDVAKFPVSLVETLKKSNCGCLRAKIQNRLIDPENPKSQLENLVTEIDRFEAREEEKCENEPQLIEYIKKWRERARFMDFIKERNQTNKVYCGWVSVNALSNNITIIDNKFDAAILRSGYPIDKLTKAISEHDEALLRESPCACVKGTLGQIQNSKGTLFNYFVQIAPSSSHWSGVMVRDDSRCFGLEWK